jgi:type I restriction enzyme S subunit
VLLARILQERCGHWEEAELAKLKAAGKTPKDDKWKAKYEEPVAPDTTSLAELPEGWCWATTDQIFWFVTSGSRGWAKYYSESGATFIRIANLDHDSISLDLSEIQHVSPPRGAEGTRTRVAPGDVLISITADVGMIGLVRDQVKEGYINQHISLARPVRDIWIPYLAWFLAARDGGQKQLLALQRGATKVGLGLDDIRSVNVPMPPLSEQQRIVDEVERCFSVAADCDAAVSRDELRLRRLRQAILKWAFEGKLADQDPSERSADALLARIRAERAILVRTANGAV